MNVKSAIEVLNIIIIIIFLLLLLLTKKNIAKGTALQGKFVNEKKNAVLFCFVLFCFVFSINRKSGVIQWEKKKLKNAY